MATLTGELQSAQSPVTQVIKRATPVLTGGRKAIAFASLYSLDNLHLSTLPSQMGSTVGTAFDLLARMHLPNFKVSESNAKMGVLNLFMFTRTTEGAAFTGYLSKAVSLYDYSVKALEYNLQSKAKIALALGDLEVLFRAGPLALTYAPGDRLRAMTSPESYYSALNNDLVKELESLLTPHTRQVIKNWASASEYIPNPSFGNADVGADGDWIINRSLVELKTTNKVDHSKLAVFIRQAVGYVLMDSKNEYALKSVTIWLPRYEKTLKFELENIVLGGITLLPVWRYQMQEAMKEVGTRERARYSV